MTLDLELLLKNQRPAWSVVQVSPSLPSVLNRCQISPPQPPKASLPHGGLSSRLKLGALCIHCRELTAWKHPHRREMTRSISHRTSTLLSPESWVSSLYDRSADSAACFSLVLSKAWVAPCILIPPVFLREGMLFTLSLSASLDF